jgi:hypothetical protein
LVAEVAVEYFQNVLRSDWISGEEDLIVDEGALAYVLTVLVSFLNQIKKIKKE